MSIFGKIMGAIFGTKAEAAPAGAPARQRRCTNGARAAPAQTIDVVPDSRGGRGGEEGKAELAHLDRRPDEGARPRLELDARARSWPRSSATPATPTTRPR